MAKNADGAGMAAFPISRPRDEIGNLACVHRSSLIKVANHRNGRTHETIKQIYMEKHEERIAA
jgi:hypothetical protein